MKLEELVFRSWYYFRNGYSTYLRFPLAFVTFISTTYYLAINNIKFLKDIFPSFTVFAIGAIIIILPLGVLVGWLHMKKTLAYPAQMAINVESNPYNYKIRPGKESEINWPMWQLMLKTMEKISEKDNTLSTDERKEYEELKIKIERLIKGEIIGEPRQRKLRAQMG